MAKNPATITVSILVLIAIALTVFYTLPARQKTRTVHAQIQKEEMVGSDLQKEVDRLNALNARLPQGDVARRALVNAVPETLLQDLLLSELNIIAETHRITFDSLNMTIVPGALLNVDAVSIASTFTGNYENLVAFLKGLEGASRRFSVKSINVQLLPGEETPSAKPRVSLSVTFEAYYQAS